MMFFFNLKKQKVPFRELIFSLATLCFFLLFTSSPLPLFSQISQGGQPASFTISQLPGIPEIILPVPDMNATRAEDMEDEKQGYPRRVGISIPSDIDIIRDGMHQVLPDGSQIWRIAISCQGALALGPYFDDFQLSEGCRMFIYNEDRQHLLGAYTLYNNSSGRLFSTELIPGERLMLEINVEQGVEVMPDCHISEISYVYRDLPDFEQSLGTADACEVNINCPEGDNWQYQKHGVARIYVKYNGGFFWCTGSLLNNTLQDNEPYLLTADHCAPTVAPDELMQWVFYFNYEAPGCDNPSSTPSSNTLTGAIKLANANTNGSDFLLLRLADTVPLNYEPFYNGWSIENIASPLGVSIHHPAGDIKKISTYTTPLETSTWYSTPGTHWQVYWTETETNWGVTEGGSSGAPLFDNTGKVIGTLTGGQAACEPNGHGSGTGPDKPDYYGKFSYSWDKNGTEPAQQLKYWLDPNNTGVTELPGKYADLTAAFKASETLILAGSSITFENLSSGLPNSLEWSFEGGSPATYSGPGPIEVLYSSAGLFDVRLEVSNGIDSDTLLLKDYIHVVGKVYPNPTSGLVNIFLDEELPSSINVQVYNILGQIIYEEQIDEQSYQLLSIDLSLCSSGIYTIRLQLNQRFLFARVMVRKL